MACGRMFEAHAQLADGSGLLVHRAVHAARVQGRCCGEATDSAANDQNSHRDLAGMHQRGTGECRHRTFTYTRGLPRAGSLQGLSCFLSL